MIYQQKSRDGSTGEGFNLGVIEKYLELLKEEKNYSKALLEGPLRLKSAFHKYLKWLVSKEFISRREDYYITIQYGEVIKKRRKPATTPSVFYKTTSKGIKFLEIIA